MKCVSGRSYEQSVMLEMERESTVLKIGLWCGRTEDGEYLSVVNRKNVRVETI